ncbi:hook-length control protein FliK [Paracoccus solventivorans]|uniref:Hook-length control protein FliK n=2 Tax=Paracoccus solventivorans TaxID=53463 RepID=A0A1M7FZ66_9RHOB|nr:hook-length control protein FliK [Paracoccus solventivorans]
MPGALAAPLARDTAAASADQSLTFRLPPLAEPYRQIADAIVRTSSGQVEITLDPIELGRVTVLLGEDGNPGRLALLVERPETLELIRRHSDQLLRDLRENGMPDAWLEDLRQDDSANQRDNPPQTSGQPEGESPSAIQPLLAAETARPVALGQLNIRF